MNRILTLAAAAATLLTTTAAHAEPGIAVTLTGKTPAQVRSDILAAAHALCVRDTTEATFRHIAIDACVRDANRRAWAEAQVKMAAMTPKKPTEVLAKN